MQRLSLLTGLCGMSTYVHLIDKGLGDADFFDDVISTASA